METTSPDRLAVITQWLGTGAINFFGLPFAGKDTHASELATFFNGAMLSGGDIIRNSAQYTHLNEHNNTGKLTPTDAFIALITPYLSHDDFAGKPLILSSVGRWIGEEKAILPALAAAHHPMKAVFYLNIDKDTMYERFHRSQQKQDRGNRGDDSLELLQTRYDEFTAKTLPVIEEYRGANLLIEIDSLKPKQEVTEDILQGLLEYASTSQ